MKHLNSPKALFAMGTVSLGLAVLVCFVAVHVLSQTRNAQKQSAPLPVATTTINDGVAACEKVAATTSVGCFRDLIIDTLKTDGLPQALNLTEKISNENPKFAIYCHTLMHDLGKEAYATYHEKGKIDVTDKLSYCNFGFYHSFMEEIVARTGGFEEAQAFCEFVGTQLENQTSAISNCYHGIGHGLSSEPAELSDPVKMAAPGLVVCRNISPEYNFRASCDTGVFNSIELLYGDPRYNLPMPENPFTYCDNDSYNDEEKKACYIEMSVLAEGMSGENFVKALEYVDVVPDHYKEYVIHYLALYSYSNLEVFDPSRTIAECRKSAPLYIDACIVGVAQGLIVSGKPGSIYAGAIEFYKKGTMTDTEKELFLDTSLRTDVYNDTEQQNVCKQFPADMRVSPPCKEEASL